MSQGHETKPDGTIWPYVDGSPFTGEVGLGTSSITSKLRSWRTYLFSSLGRGGRGVFALDVTNVSNLQSGESNASSIFKWQFTSDDNSDLGYIVNDFPENDKHAPTHANCKNEQWQVCLPSG